MPESVGTVHLSISADLDTLGANLRAKLSKMAPDLGRKFSDDFSSAFAKNLSPAMTSAVRKAFDQAARSVGAIKVDIDVDTNAAKARIEALDSEHPTVTVDVDVNAAQAKRKISELDNEHPTVTVDVDTKKAKGGLRDLSSGISEVTGSISTIGALGVASMGTLIPVAVAATGAVLALGVAAAGVGASFGVAALAFTGVGSALTALNNQESKAGETAAQAQTAALSLAGAYDGLKSARLGVADAEHEAGLATAQAAAQTAAAERDLKAAQADELQTQKDLNLAREQAIRDLEDIANRAADAALNQRQAALDLTDAQTAYDKVLANPRSTAEQKERAKLTRDQAVQRKKEADEEAKRSAVDAAKAKKAGVEGSDAVTAARQRQKAAVDKVHDAEQKVIDAQKNEGEVARKNAESIAKAEQSVVSAQRSVQAALIATQQIGATTRNAVDEAFADLSPAGQHFAKFIFGLKGQFDVLRGAAQTALLPPLERAIKILLPYLPQVRTFVSNVGAAMGDVAIKIAKMFTDKSWKDFFKILAQDTPGILRSLGDTFVSLGKVLARVFTAAAPYAKELIGNVADFFKNLDQETSGKKGESKLKRLFEGIMPTLGAVWNVIKSIGNVIQSIATAGSNGQGSAADTLNKIADSFNKLATYVDAHPQVVGQMVKLAAGLVALKAANPAVSALGSIGSALGGFATFASVAWKWGAALFAEGGLLGAGGAFTTAMEAVGAAIAAISAPVWIAIGVIALVVGGLILLYFKCQWFHDKVNTIVHAVGQFFVWLWNTAIHPAINAIGAVMQWLYEHVVQPIWTLIWTAIKIAWAIIEVIFGTIKIELKILGMAWSWLYDHVIHPVWNWIADHISTVWNKNIKPILDTVGSYIHDHVAPVFQKAIGVLGTIWDSLMEIFKAPIRFFIQTILDDGLFAAYNNVAKFFHVTPDNVHVDVPPLLQPKKRATGGAIFGAGTETSDSIPALLSNNEHVWTAAEVRAAGGHGAVQAIRQAVLNGGVPRFADGGGVFGWLGSAVGAVGNAGKWAWNKAQDIAGFVSGFISDPLGTMKNVASQTLNGLPGGKDGLMGKAIVGATGKVVNGIVDFAKNFMGFGDATGGGPSISGGNAANQAIGQAMAAARGWTGAQWESLKSLWNGESGWNDQALNQSSGAFGIPQSLPASKMAAAGPDWRTNPATQIRWGLDYIGSAYGSPGGAYAKWLMRSPHWYDQGGWLQPGSTLVQNDTGKPEAVFSASQWAVLKENLGYDSGGDYSRTNHINVTAGAGAEDIARAIAAEQSRRDLLDAISG